MKSIDRIGQTWQEDGKLFVVVGRPISHDLWARHPVCYLDDKGEQLVDEYHVDEGDIMWENLPYMHRLM